MIRRTDSEKNMGKYVGRWVGNRRRERERENGFSMMCSPQWIHVAWLEQRCDANPSSCNAHPLRMDHQLLSPFISPSPSFPSAICKMDSQWNLLYDSGNLHWGSVTIYRVGRRFKKKRTYIYLWVIHVDVWQKLNQYCKTIILQLKINTFFLKEWISSNIKQTTQLKNGRKSK